MRTQGDRLPSDTALALAELLGDQGSDPIIDLDVYRRLIDGEERAMSRDTLYMQEGPVAVTRHDGTPRHEPTRPDGDF